ncbi:protein translocase subunit SecF [Clostridium tarantellae]|uniref:Protein-export membrane protein SecF n=1 Tax=Clostridium tarantellae TaxID=39493 RepID=A0A6I1MI41_9CLOT|nr:protein translocase subunit SecF [Clostridium tarantellae]MPQ43035.1 protein translocase subunit SecF [Clostridium tarantellae]
MLKVVEKSKWWISASLIIIVIGLGFMFTKGLNFGIDFKGGTQVVIDFGKDFNKAEVDEIIANYAVEPVTNKLENTQLEIKSKDLSSSKLNELFTQLKEKYSLEDSALVSQDEIGSSIGNELTKSSIIALAIAVVAMLIYVAVRFEFAFGIASIIALAHDILITLSIFAIFQITVNTPFIAAILTIVGYSINDTIVIFDRIRENRKKMRSASYVEVADTSITQTMSRSINTTITTLITIVAVYVFVPTIRDFAFPLIVGIACGAYSSIFIASPVWCFIKNRKAKNKRKEEKKA